jgi:iron(III)-enterobactin esterase
MQRRLRHTSALSLLCLAAGASACEEDATGDSLAPVQSTAPSPSASSSSPTATVVNPQPLPAVGPTEPTTVNSSVPTSPGATTVSPPPTGPSAEPPGTAGAGPEPEPSTTNQPTSGGAPSVDSGAPPVVIPDADSGVVTPPEVDSGALEPGPEELPDPGPEGDGDFEVGPNPAPQAEVGNQGAPRGETFRFTMPLAESELFNGQDPTLDPSKPVNQNRGISVYVPAQYVDGTPAPVLVIQDGDGPLGAVSNALDNLTISDDAERRLPAFIAVAVQNGGNDAQGSERGLEYDTMSDRYARFIDEEVLPAVEANSDVRAAYPNLRFTTNPSGRAALGCSSGGAAAFTMAWFRPDLFSRVVAYSTTLVDQQNHESAEAEIYPHGAWDYHSELELIANSEKKPIRVFLNVNENDLRANDDESTLHNWVMANERTAAALAAKDYHYRYVLGLGAGHCDGGIQQATLADALIWVWRGYEPTAD